MDAYINVVGGLKVSETACDLAIIAAVYSALKDRPIRPDTLVIGEVGLTGEIRPIADIERRLTEAGRLGFSSCILPGGNKPGLDRTARQRSASSKGVLGSIMNGISPDKVLKGSNGSSHDTADSSGFPELIYADTLSEAMDVLFAQDNSEKSNRGNG